jgi:hypothetical protein
MLAVVRDCDECGKAYEAKRKTSKFCSTQCRVKANRRPSKVGKAKAKADAAAPAKPLAPTYDALAEQVTQTLTTMKAYDTIAGKAALRVAQQIDRGGDTGSAVATLSTQLMRLVDQAKAEAAPLNRDKADDVIDAVNNKLIRLMS